MIGPAGTVRVMVATRPVDFRKGADGLAALVRDTMAADPFGGTVFVFRAKRAEFGRAPGWQSQSGCRTEGDRIKLIFWDGSGLVLVAKRLEDGAFKWPTITDGVIRLTAAQLSALLEGLDWRRVHESRQTMVPVAPS